MSPIMTHTTGPSFFVLFPLLHLAAFAALVAGFVLLLMWAYKHLPPAQLKKWGLILFIGGAVVCLLTLMMGAGHGKMRMMKGDGMMREGMMKNGMMERDDGGSMMGGAMMMRSSSSEGAASSAN